MKKSSGFTLMEILVTITIFAILVGIVIVRIRPQRQIDVARNAQRTSHVVALADAVSFYALETMGSYPAGIDDTLRMIGTSTGDCTATCPLLGGGAPAEPPAGPSSLVDDSQSGFDAGTYSDTQWSAGSSAVTLDATGQQVNGTGTYTSEIKDATETTTWQSLSWLPAQPYGKPLPSPFTANETGYPAGNMSMANNVLLYHMDQTSGTIGDSSGNAITGTLPAGISYSQAGKFLTALGFNGANQYISAGPNALLRLSNSAGSVAFWVYLDPTLNPAQDTSVGLFRQLNDSNWSAPSGYGMDIYRNTPGGPLNLRAHYAQAWNNVQILTGATALQPGSWYHVGLTWTGSNISIYLNGGVEVSTAKTKTITWNTNLPMIIGHNFAGIANGRAWFKGRMDEFAVFARTLTPTEMSGLYKRGALNLRFQVRACDDAACSGEAFVGPDGTANTYYSELINTSLNPPALTLQNLGDAQYFQYRTTFDTSDSAITPELQSVTLANTAGGGGGESPADENMTASACLNLEPVLVPTYLNDVPKDPQTGTAEITNYAIKTVPGGIMVRACTPALDNEIEIIQ